MKIDFSKGLVPAVIQHACTSAVLMVGFMNEEAFMKTTGEGKVTFFSRSRNRLWTKGETSGNYLYVKEIIADCDNDSLLIKADPAGPVCHTGQKSCFGEDRAKGFLYQLEHIIEERSQGNDEKSYTRKLLKEGVNRIAKKFGEESVELIIEAKDNNDILFKNEASDMLYHFLVLLKAKGFRLEDIEETLKERHDSR